MKTKRDRSKNRIVRTPALIRTTLMELLQEIGQLTTDDDLVLAIVKDIFRMHRVRFASSLAPVRLVGARLPLDAAIKPA
jgi:hypothetical protein